MKEYNQPNDLKLFYVTATSFPDGIKAAFEKLEKIIGDTKGRTFFGISHGTKEGKIIYKAAVLEQYEGEGEGKGCETFILKEGEYLAETISDWRKRMELIGETFKKLLADPRLDPQSYCVEWYKNGEVMCMVGINPVKA